MKHEVARKSIFAKVCYFSLSLSFSPSLPLLESRQCQAERLTDWLTEAGRASSGNPRTYRVGSFLRRVACTARSMEFLLSGLHPRVVAPSPPSLLRQLRRVLVYPCTTPLVQPPSAVIAERDTGSRNRGRYIVVSVVFSFPLGNSAPNKASSEEYAYVSFGARCTSGLLFALRT